MSKESEFERNNDQPGEPEQPREARRQRRAERRADRQDGGLGWVVGLVLIAIGGLYLLQDFGITPALTNWWALFLLLPGIGTLSAARAAYSRNGGHWTMEVSGPFLFGLFFVGLTIIFLFGLNFSWVIPWLLIIAGLFLVISPVLARK